jgi:hypothetical protein
MKSLRLSSAPRCVVAGIALACMAFGCGSGDAGNRAGGVDAGTRDAKADVGVNTQTGCAEATKSIYIVSNQNAFYRYQPERDDLQVTGLLRCDDQVIAPTSMAVDRSGIAWVRLGDGTLRRVTTTGTLDCTSTNFLAPSGAFAQFGMGYSSDVAGTDRETLFLADSAGGGLAKLNTSSLVLTKLGAFTGAALGQRAELTGTGDGRLFGFFTRSNPAKIGEIDKATGAVKDLRDLPGVSATSDWAFAFFGGNFYTFTASVSGNGLPMNDGGSTVHRYNPVSGEVKIVKTLTFRVVGAGVSTCAPLVSIVN